MIFEVSPLTIQYLEAEGVIETKKGGGSFVRADIRENRMNRFFLIFGQMILDGLKSLPAAAGITAAALLIIFLFWKSGRMEGTRDVL